MTADSTKIARSPAVREAQARQRAASRNRPPLQSVPLISRLFPVLYKFETAARNRDGKRILCIGPASFYAFVTEDALRVIAHIQIIVDLHGLVYGFRAAAITLGPGFVLLDVGLGLGSCGKVNR